MASNATSRGEEIMEDPFVQNNNWESENGSVSTTRSRCLAEEAKVEEQSGSAKDEQRKLKKKRSRKRTVVLVVRVFIVSAIVVVYLLVGAGTMHALEIEAEMIRLNEAEAASEAISRKIIAILNAFQRNETNVSAEKLTMDLIENITEATAMGAFEPPVTSWDFPQAVHFSLAAITTIGYGNVYPQTLGGRIFIVFYTLFGIPLTLIFLTTMGQLLSRALKTCLKPFRKHYPLLVLAYVMMLGLFFVLVVLIPAAVFYLVENSESRNRFSYMDMVYFCYISISTVGFGDIVLLGDNSIDTPVQLAFYIIFIVLWLSLGLAYLSLIIQEVLNLFSLISKVLMKRTPLRNVAVDEEFEKRPLEKLIKRVKKGARTIRYTFRQNAFANNHKEIANKCNPLVQMENEEELRERMIISIDTSEV